MAGGAMVRTAEAGTAAAQPVPEPQDTAEQPSSHSNHSTPPGSSPAPTAIPAQRTASNKASSKSKVATASSRSSSSWQGAAVKLLLAAASAATLSWLFNKWRSNSRSDSKAAAAADQPPEPEPTLPVLVDVHNTPRLPQGVAAAEGALAGINCVVADNVDVQGWVTSAGLARPEGTAAATDDSPAALQLLSQGVTLAAQCSSQPCNYPSLGDNIRNPNAVWRITGGGASGAAAAVAMGLSQLGLGSEYFASIRLPAACCGIYGYVATPGVIGSTTTSSSSSSSASSAGQIQESAGLISIDLQLLCRVGRALRLPGAVNLKHEVTQVVVAEDLFELCEPSDMGPGILTMKRAVISWAGQDQAGSVQLLPFLANNLVGWQELVGEEEQAAAATWQAQQGADAATAPKGLNRPAPPVMCAIHRAAVILYQHHLAAQYSHRLPLELAGNAAAAEQAAAEGAAQAASSRTHSAASSSSRSRTRSRSSTPARGVSAAPDGATPSGANAASSSSSSPRQRLSPADAALLQDVEAAIAAGKGHTPQQVAAAEALAAGVAHLMRSAINRDLILVTPIVPAAPIRLDAPAEQQAAFLSRSQQFAALAALAGLPSVTLPVGLLGDGAPLSVALCAQPKSDQRLLDVACALMPHVRGELEKQQAEATTAAAIAAASTSGRSGKRSSISSGAAGRTKRTSTSSGAPPAAAARSQQRTGRSSSSGERPGAAMSGGGRSSGAAAVAGTGDAQAVDAKKVERAEKFKAKGNELFKAGRYPEAIKQYTEAIRAHPEHPVYYSNRAMAYLKAFMFEQAEEDCNAALSFDLAPPDKAKALLRRGTARVHLYRGPDALQDFQAVLRLEPNNRQAKEEVQALRQQQAEMLAAQEVLQKHNGGGGDGSLPPGMEELLAAAQQAQDEAAASGSPEAAAAAAAAAASAAAYLSPETAQEVLAGLSEEQYAAMLGAGEVPMLMGEGGRPLLGEGGQQPVLVGPDGRPRVVGPAGNMAPYRPHGR